MQYFIYSLYLHFKSVVLLALRRLFQRIADQMDRTLMLFIFTSIFSHSAAATISLSDLLSTHANLSSLNSLLTTQLPDLLTGLEGYNSSNQITILAPSDQAFANVPNVDVIGPAWTNNDTAELRDVLLYHALPGAHTPQSLNSSFHFLPTLFQSSNQTNVTGGQRIGAVLQSGNPPEIVFVSGESTRSVATEQDVAFSGG
jgi:uncharacterized surface protein with fasciclin (FAS1) repeats